MALMNDPTGRPGWEMVIIFNNAGRALPESSRFQLTYSDKLPDPPKEDDLPKPTDVAAIRMDVDRQLSGVDPSDRPEVVQVRIYRIPRNKLSNKLLRPFAFGNPDKSHLDVNIPLDVLLELSKLDPMPRLIKLTQMAPEQPDPVVYMPLPRKADDPQDFVEAIVVHGIDLEHTLPDQSMPLPGYDHLFPPIYADTSEPNDAYVALVRDVIVATIKRYRALNPHDGTIPTFAEVGRVPSAQWDQSVRSGAKMSEILKHSPIPRAKIDLPPFER